MAKIKVISDRPLIDGMAVTFRTPCECSAVDGLTVSYLGSAQDFTFRDAHGSDLNGLGNLFSEGVLVQALLDVTNSCAYIQNADTNTYLENRIGSPCQVTKLWENSVWNSSFSERILLLDSLSEYEFVEIHYTYNASSSFFYSQRGPVNTELMLIGVSGYKGEVASRQVEVLQDGMITIKAAYHGSSTVANSYIIPVAIYGIKGVTSAIVETPDYSGDV